MGISLAVEIKVAKMMVLWLFNLLLMTHVGAYYVWAWFFPERPAEMVFWLWALGMLASVLGITLARYRCAADC